MFAPIERGELDTLYIIGENPAQSEADQKHAIALLRGLRRLIVQDIFLTKTGELADVVFPASSSWCETEGTVTSSERRVQRVRKALEPPGEARDDIAILCELARRLGHDWPEYSARTDLGRVPLALAVARRHELRAARGARRHSVALLRREPSRRAVLARAPLARAAAKGRPRRSRRSTTTRRSKRSTTSIRCGSRRAAGSTRSTPACRAAATRRRCGAARRSTSRPKTPQRYGVADGDRVRVTSRRGSVVVPVRVDPGLRAGLVFTTFHLQRRRRDQPADDRRNRPEVGHRGVQSVCGANRAARPRGRRDVTDLHFTSATATDEERAAVDALLGPRDGGRPGRDLLLPALHAVSDSVGWISAGAVNYVGERLGVAPAEVYGVATFYKLFSTTPAPKRVVHVCDDIACICAGAEARCEEIERSGVAWHRSPCLGQCDRAPATLDDRGRHAQRGCGRRSAAARRRHRAAPAAARGQRRPREPRRVSRGRRLRRAAPGVRTRPGRHRGGGRGIEAARPRRRRVSDRPEDGGRRERARDDRTTWCATPTSRSRARSRTAS